MATAIVVDPATAVGLVHAMSACTLARRAAAALRRIRRVAPRTVVLVHSMAVASAVAMLVLKVSAQGQVPVFGFLLE